MSRVGVFTCEDLSGSAEGSFLFGVGGGDARLGLVDARLIAIDARLYGVDARKR